MVFDGLRKMVSWGFRRESSDTSGDLYLAQCLFLFIRQEGDSNDDLWKKYLDSISAICNGSIITQDSKAVRDCLRKSRFNESNIDQLTPNAVETIINSEYRNLFLSATFLRYTLMTFCPLDLAGSREDILEECRSFVNVHESIKGELDELIKILRLKFSEYFVALLKKGESLLCDTESSDFRSAVFAFRSIFGKTPETKIDFAVGFYIELASKYIGSVGQLMERFVEKLEFSTGDDGQSG